MTKRKTRRQHGSAARAREGGWTVRAVTFVVLMASLYVVLGHGYDDAAQNWAYATIGSILTYWLKR